MIELEHSVMEKQYYHCKYTPAICFIIKRARALILLNTILIIIALSHIFLIAEAKASSSSSGFQVFVHVIGGSGKASVCVYSDRENLGCRIITSPDTVPFTFNTQSMEFGEKFKTCIQAIKLYCTTSTYDALTARGKHVYLSIPEMNNDNVNQENNKLQTKLGASLMKISYSQNFLLYTNPDHDFKVWYPSSWSVDEGNITHSGVLITSPDRAAKILVSAINISPAESEMTPAELAKSILSSQNDSRSRFIELDANNYFLSGRPAVKIVQIRNNDTGLDDSSDTPYKSMSLVTLLEGKAYFVSYIAQPELFPNYLQTAQTIIDSFEITNK
jgi:hypothetical protein